MHVGREGRLRARMPGLPLCRFRYRCGQVFAAERNPCESVSALPLSNRFTTIGGNDRRRVTYEALVWRRA